jgi:hypothetical protein
MKPADFLLGLLDFFAILLPGAVGAWLVSQYIPGDDRQRLLSLAGTPLTESGLWAVFVLAAYTLGHFIFMAGSKLDTLYDRWRRRVKPTGRDKAFQAARMVQEAVNPELVGGDFTLLKWAKSYVQVKSPGARLDIDRLEATEKFFRSFVVVAGALTAHFLLKERRFEMAFASAILAVMSYQRFIDQRWKATELAYGTAAILGVMPAEARKTQGGSGTRAGGEEA